MEAPKIITGVTDDEIWSNLASDIGVEDDLLTYDVIIKQGEASIRLYIDIDPGGGFEGGYEATQFSASLLADTDFRFAIHHEDFFDEVGKFFGMQDVEIGYPELDQQVVIKTNDEQKVKRVLDDPQVRTVLTTLEDFNFGIHKHTLSNEQYPVLELNINQGITEVAALRDIYHAFYSVLIKIG